MGKEEEREREGGCKEWKRWVRKRGGDIKGERLGRDMGRFGQERGFRVGYELGGCGGYEIVDSSGGEEKYGIVWDEIRDSVERKWIVQGKQTQY